MKFYAYMETSEGKEPLGTEGCYLFELETIPGAIRRARNLMTLPHLKTAKFNGVLRLFTYSNFYDEKTFTKIL